MAWHSIASQMISPFLYMLDLNHPSVDRHVYTCLLDLIQKKHPKLFTDEQLYFSWGGKLACVLLYCAYPEGVVCGALLKSQRQWWNPYHCKISCSPLIQIPTKSCMKCYTFFAEEWASLWPFIVSMHSSHFGHSSRLALGSFSGHRCSGLVVLTGVVCGFEITRQNVPVNNLFWFSLCAFFTLFSAIFSSDQTVKSDTIFES